MNVNPWILTATGNKFHYLNYDPEEYNLVDCAAAMSRLCRYNGHISDEYMDDIYSVAQHSVYVYWLLRDKGAPTWTYPWAVCHDVPEAYWTDVPSPLKSLLPDYKVMENRSAEQMRGIWGIPYDETVKKHVGWADVQMLYAESNTLTNTPAEMWCDLFNGSHDPTLRMTDIDPDFRLWGPKEARERFLEAFMEAMQYSHLTKDELCRLI